MGYSYTLSYAPKAARRAQPSVVRARIPRIDGSILISFLDLMELRVVKALIDRGLSLQHVRQVAGLASELFNTAYPFASRRIFTDGREVFASLSRVKADEVLIELSAKHDQLIAALSSSSISPNWISMSNRSWRNGGGHLDVPYQSY